MDKTNNNNQKDKTKKKKRTSLAKKNIFRMCLLGAFILVTSFIVSGVQIYRYNMEDYADFATSYSTFISENIDPEIIKTYLDTRQKDENYENIVWALLTANRSGLFRDIYIAVPGDDHFTYIADVYFPDGNLPEDKYLEEAEKKQVQFLEERKYTPMEKEGVENVKTNATTTAFIGLELNGAEIVATTMSPILDVTGEVPETVAIIGMDISMNDIWNKMLRMDLNLLLAITIILVVGMVIYYYFLNRSIISPIVKLNKATQDLVQKLDEDEEFKVDVNTNDEIEVLANSFEEMDRNLKRYVKENTAITVEKERLLTELDLAQRIQTDMLPGVFPPFPERTDFDIYASMDPAKVVGGDFYDFFLIDQEHIGLVMADVSGKGIPAALFMMMAKIMIQNLAKTGLSPKAVLERVNNQICENNNEEMFVTVWLGVLDLTSGVIVAVNAGHEYPVLKSPEGEFSMFRDKHGFVIGGMEGVPYKEYEIKLEPGSKLFLYTDGLPEATNASDELFGEERMLAALNSVCDKKPDEILPAVKAAADEFVGDAPQFDDLTMMCVSYYGK